VPAAQPLANTSNRALKEDAMSNKHAGPLHVVLIALLGLLTACSERKPAPLTTSVCELSMYAQRAVQIDAEISAGPGGVPLIGDPRCPTTKVELRLSGAATRAGAEEQLKAAAQRATGSGSQSFPARLSGVFTNATTGDYFIAESFSELPPPK
jgi:hypothetical protein